MSNITEEEVMASMMKSGDRVLRGKDWGVNWEFDGNGPGTVVEKGSVIKIPNIVPNVMCYPDQETKIANVAQNIKSTSVWIIHQVDMLSLELMFMIQEEEMIK